MTHTERTEMEKLATKHVKGTEKKTQSAAFHGYCSGFEKAMKSQTEIRAENKKLRDAYQELKLGIEKYAKDTVWVSPFETVCDFIDELLHPSPIKCGLCCEGKPCNFANCPNDKDE